MGFQLVWERLIWQFPERLYWVAVKELKLRYYIGETLLFTIYTHYGNLKLSSLTATQY